MIPLTFLCDEYIDRPKLTEQKKPIWVFSSSPPPPPPPQVGSEQKVSIFSMDRFIENSSEEESKQCYANEFPRSI